MTISTVKNVPTGKCDPDVFENGKSACIVVISKETAEEICRGITAATGCKVDWHYFGGRVHIKALAPPAPAVPSEQLIGMANHIAGSVGGLPDEWQDWATEIASDLRRLAISTPAPAYPEKLPCAVHLLPGLKFGTGIATKTLLEALARREKYNLDISAMTVVERAEHFAKTMRPQSDHLNSAIKLAEEASKLADRIREEELTPPSVQTDELVMQIRRLVHSLKKAKPDSLLVQQVTEYMKRHGYFKATDCLRGEVEGKN